MWWCGMTLHNLTQLETHKNEREHVAVWLVSLAVISLKSVCINLRTWHRNGVANHGGSDPFGENLVEKETWLRFFLANQTKTGRWVWRRHIIHAHTISM